MPEQIDPPPVEETEIVPLKSNIPVVNDDKHLQTLVEEMPKVVPDAVEAANNKEAAAQEVQAAAKDKKGRPFDAAIHAADDQGRPIMTPTGQFKKKLRLPGQKAGPGGVTLPPEQPAPDMKIKNAAQKLAQVFIVTGISFFGDEWKPEISKDFNELQMLTDANERWMIENGLIEPPAWVDLALAYGLYCGKRIVQRKPEGRIQKIIEWGKQKATNFWLWVTGQKIKVVSTEKK